MVNDDFVILRAMDALSDRSAVVKNLSRAASNKIIVEWGSITIVICGEADCTFNGKNYNEWAHDKTISLPNYFLLGHKRQVICL